MPAAILQVLQVYIAGIAGDSNALDSGYFFFETLLFSPLKSDLVLFKKRTTHYKEIEITHTHTLQATAGPR